MKDQIRIFIDGAGERHLQFREVWRIHFNGTIDYRNWITIDESKLTTYMAPQMNLGACCLDMQIGSDNGCHNCGKYLSE